MKIVQSVYNEIMNTVGKVPPETGGILGSRDLGTVTHFYFDKSGVTTDHSYTPDTEAINLLLEKWASEGIYLVGFIHSHSAELPFPSCMDLRYGEKILCALSHLNRFFMPIVVFGDSVYVSAYVLETDNNGMLKTEKTKLEII